MNQKHAQQHKSLHSPVRGGSETAEQIDRALDLALEATFPASDALAITMPYPAAGQADRTSA